MAIENVPRYSLAYYNRLKAYFLSKEYDKSWQDLYKAQELGHQVKPGFIQRLKDASDREF